MFIYFVLIFTIVALPELQAMEFCCMKPMEVDSDIEKVRSDFYSGYAIMDGEHVVTYHDKQCPEKLTYYNCTYIERNATVTDCIIHNPYLACPLYAAGGSIIVCKNQTAWWWGWKYYHGVTLSKLNQVEFKPWWNAIFKNTKTEIYGQDCDYYD